MPNETRTYRRSELYEQVWAEPVRVVAKQYGVSDVALAKTCRKLAVPLPGVGYWARKRAGGRTRRTPLPPLPAGVSEETTIRWDRPDRAPLSPDVEAAVGELRDPSAAIQVPEVLSEPHALVARAEKMLRRARPKNGIVHCRGEHCLDISVAPASLDRALRLFDTIIKALEIRGLPVEVAQSEQTFSLEFRYRSHRNQGSIVTRVRIADEWLEFGIIEDLQPKPATPGPAASSGGGNRNVAFEPSGRLELFIRCDEHVPGRRVWRDGRRQRIEDCLTDFLVNLHAKADAIGKNRAERERSHQEYKEKERVRAEAERLAQEDERRATEFEAMIARWRLARDIREFCTLAKQMVRDSECHLLRGGGLREQIIWGLAYADKIDPLRSVEEELAGHLRSRRTKAMLGSAYTPPFPEG